MASLPIALRYQLFSLQFAISKANRRFVIEKLCKRSAIVTDSNITLRFLCNSVKFFEFSPDKCQNNHVVGQRLTIQSIKYISIIAFLSCSIPLLSACDSIRGQSATSEAGTRSNRTPSMLAFEFVSGSGINNIELIGCDGNVLFDPAHQTSTSVTDFSAGAEFETDMTTAFFFDDFSFDCFKKVKVASEKTQAEIDVDSLEWQVNGPGRTFDFEYQVSYSTVLDSRTKPLFNGQNTP